MSCGSHGPIGDAEFASLLDPLGPFEPRPRLAVAVSGGADSLALCLLARRWAVARGGEALAVVCDHGLRDGSGDEATLVASGLRSRGIAATVLKLAVPSGPGVAKRARAARYAALERECAAAGLLHLLLGHHAADQAETVAMRLLHGSGQVGLSGMAAVAEGRSVRLLRPLLTASPARLRDTLGAFGADWLEDPTNGDARHLRPRLRELRRDRLGAGPVVAAALAAATLRGHRRHVRDAETVQSLAASVRLHPAGYALISRDLIEGDVAEAFAAIIRAVSGAFRLPPLVQAAAWLANPRAATLGGTQIQPAGRLCRDGWLVVRELAAVEPPVAATFDLWWDRRFRLRGAVAGVCGALGEQASEYRHLTPLPLIVLQTLPAIRVASRVVGIPHLNVGNSAVSSVFSPAAPLSGVFWPPGSNHSTAGMHKAARPPILTPA